MDHSKVNRIINQVLLEKSFTEFYKMGESCKGWETNVVTQPAAVKNIVNSGAERIAAGPGIGAQISDGIANKIDHTLLKPDTTVDDIIALCDEAAEYKFASVCINPCYIPLCREKLSGTGVKVCTVIGFPLGSTTTEVKRTEAEQALANGAEELDMVINVGKLKSGDYEYVFNDIQQVVLPAKKVRALVKVIIETSLLTDEEKIKACVIAKDAGASFVKTSTGFSKGGATAGDVALMKYVVGSTVGVKASGGIRSREDADTMIESGADRIGASASVKIVTGGNNSGEGY